MKNERRDLSRAIVATEDVRHPEPAPAPSPAASETVLLPGVIMPYAIDEHGNGVPWEHARESMEDPLVLLGISDGWHQPEVLSGVLAEVPFADLVTWLQIGRFTGSVRVARSGNLARLYLEEGTVRFAELDSGETGEEAIEHVLSWTEGSFDVSFGFGGAFAMPVAH